MAGHTEANGVRAPRKSSGGRKSRHRTKKPAQGETAEVRAVQPGLNLPKTRDFEHHYRTLHGLKAKVTEAQGRFRAAVKIADEAGVDTKAILDTIRYETKDSLKVSGYFGQLSKLFEMRGMPVQFRLFDPLAGSPLEQAERDGKRDGESARAPETAWPEGSEEHKAYMAAWNNAQAANAAKLGENAAGNAGEL